MRQEFIEIDGVKYPQGTIFVMKVLDGISATEQRYIFICCDTEKPFYEFMRPGGGIIIYPDLRFKNSIVKIDMSDEKEKCMIQNYLQREETRLKASKKYKATDVDVFFVMILIAALIAIFPPAAIIVGLVATIIATKK